jgi:hypothetical protein
LKSKSPFDFARDRPCGKERDKTEAPGGGRQNAKDALVFAGPLVAGRFSDVVRVCLYTCQLTGAHSRPNIAATGLEPCP